MPSANERHPESMRTVPWLLPAGRDSVSEDVHGDPRIDSLPGVGMCGWGSFLKPTSPSQPPGMSGFPIISGGLPGNVQGDSPGVPGSIPGDAQGDPGSASPKDPLKAIYTNSRSTAFAAVML